MIRERNGVQSRRQARPVVARSPDRATHRVVGFPDRELRYAKPKHERGDLRSARWHGRETVPQRRRCARMILPVLVVLVTILMLPTAAYAVRAHYGRVLAPRLEKEGKYEDAAFYYREGLDFYAAMMQLWIGWGVYDTRGDEIYRTYDTIFGTDKGYRGAHNEERWDPMGGGGYYYFFNREGAARSVENGRFSRAQRARLEDRARIYMEDLMDPDHGFGGDFAFSRKAWILERTGLFWHASFRRELAGRYAIMVCSRYCDAIADEMERTFGNPARADLYRQRAAWWRTRGLEEFRLSNGNRILARLKGNNKSQRLTRQEVVSVLKQGLRDEDADARRASVRILSDLGEPGALKEAVRDGVVESGEINAERKDRVRPTTDALRAGVLCEYFEAPSQDKPISAKVMDAVDVGMKLQINFPRVFYDYWDKPEVFPADATGPFYLRIRGKLLVPHDGNYRFYAKTVVESRATVSIRDTGGSSLEIISPRYDDNLQYVMQPAMPTHRIDFSMPVALKEGLADLEIVYSGDEVRNMRQGDDHIVRTSGIQKDGIKLFWSSDKHFTELVPAEHLFHSTEAKRAP